MNSLILRLTDFLSRTLDPDDQEAVRGDCDESAQTSLETLHDVFGLVVRRQVGLWANWRPWLTLIGVAAPTAVLLIVGGSWLARAYALQLWVFRNYADLDPKFLRESHTTLGEGLLFLMSRSLLLAGWSWSSGLVIGRLAGRASFIIGVLFSIYLVASGIARSTAAYRYDFDASVLALIQEALLLLIPAMWGMYQSRRARLSPSVRKLLWLASATTAFAVPTLFWWPTPTALHPWTGLLAGCWYIPLIYVFVTAKCVRPENC